MKQQKVSILIPVYNRENLIEETVKSALSQTYENIEIIVVDNKSTDNTWGILQQLALEDKRVKIFQNEKNIGPVRNWKRCIDEATGEYGKILWSDDLIAPDFLKKTLPFLQKEDVGFVYTKTILFHNINDLSNKIYSIGKTGVYKSEKYIQGVLFDVNYPVSPGCAIFRMKDLKENLLVDVPNSIGSDFSTHAIGNDLLIFLLTAHKYKLFAYVDEKLSFFRVHDGSITIASNKGRISLHYALASSYFIENKRIDLVKKQNTSIQILLRRYKKEAKKYKMFNLNNFYTQNENLGLDYLFLFRKMASKIKTKLHI
ncbi:glycosyltransferase family 2 protein [Capnocytophaga stomatis]|uniref:Glycosyltransferase family 2 protein n=1 Tax=Capnocytophaga stomatis TaxID=1848904 RepID=A0ABW8Q900_9FLAO|nr:glycosyltransferase family 2 protein [Capnocytophaga stomatis]GIJ94264.1 glycosyl transferase [Capnocytophaga stomatis]